MGGVAILFKQGRGRGVEGGAGLGRTATGGEAGDCIEVGGGMGGVSIVAVIFRHKENQGI